MSERKTLLCVSIEASGDRILAQVIQRLDLSVWRVIGIGGDHSQRAGLERIIDPRSLAAHGLGEALHVLPATLRAWRTLKRLAVSADAYLLVDAPELNMRLTRWVKRHESAEVRSRPLLYIAPPQAWAWRPRRARHLKRADRVYCLFEFAAAWYRERGVHALYIGHPLRSHRAGELECKSKPETEPDLEADVYTQDQPDVLRDSKRAPQDLSNLVLALFPGSRRSSVKRALPLMVSGAALATRRLSSSLTLSSLTLRIAETPWVSSALYESIYREVELELSRAGWRRVALGVYEDTIESDQSGAQQRLKRPKRLKLKRVSCSSSSSSPILSPSPSPSPSLDSLISAQSAPHPALSGAHLSLCYAGTSTLESALAGVPPLTISPLTWLSTSIARRLVKLKACALPNLILDQHAFPELPPWESDTPTLARALSELIMIHSQENSRFTDALNALYDRTQPINARAVADDLYALSSTSPQPIHTKATSDLGIP